MRRQRGFTLLEVTVSLAILALGLVVLLESQAASLAAAGRSRDITVGSMLARAKMIDIEQKLFDEGFTLGETKEEGDFEEEGHPTYKWSYRISEVELDINGLGGLCSGFGDASGDEEGGGADCEGMLGGMGGMLQTFTDQIGQSLRLVVLTVSWPDGKYTESMSVRALVTREDFGLQQAPLTAPILP